MADSQDLQHCEYCGAVLPHRTAICTCGVVNARPWHRVQLRTIFAWTTEAAIGLAITRASYAFYGRFDPAAFVFGAVVLMLIMMLTRTYLERGKTTD